MDTHICGNVNSYAASVFNSHSHNLLWVLLFVYLLYQNSLSGMNMLLTHEHLDNTDRKNMLALIGQCRVSKLSS